ncbi:MAG: FAD:protein FMN transferase [candidate division KSB1 bacterium]|nr:FAD:protein FMN transferase [candidate division KSB1 bacterium]
MHTRFEVVWWGVDKSSSLALFEEIRSLLDWMERQISCHDPQSQLYRLNRLARDRAVPVSDDLFQVLKTVEDYRERTLGCFDPNFLHPPNAQQTGARLIFDNSSKSIRFNDPATQLDLGAVGKGLALEKINNDILRNNVEHAFISFGESSILTRGRHPIGDYWPLGLSDMHQPGKTLYAMKLTNHSVSVSSTRKKTADGKAGTYHIYHPYHGKLIQQDKMVMVKSTSPVEAEVLSTALLVADADLQQQILKNFAVEEAVQIIYHHQSPKIIRLI